MKLDIPSFETRISSLEDWLHWKLDRWKSNCSHPNLYKATPIALPLASDQPSWLFLLYTYHKTSRSCCHHPQWPAVPTSPCVYCLWYWRSHHIWRLWSFPTSVHLWLLQMKLQSEFSFYLNLWCPLTWYLSFHSKITTATPHHHRQRGLLHRTQPPFPGNFALRTPCAYINLHR